MESLPDDIVTDILSRVPVKNLLQIKCVCKLWNTTISHPKFANLQLKQSYPGNNNSIIVVFPFARGSPIFLDYDDVQQQPDKLSLSKVDFPLSNNGYYLTHSGSCNGLLCVELDKEIVIWNPSIRQHRVLPKEDDDDDPDEHGCICFGYDSTHDDYKVVKAFYNQGGGKVFSLKRNSWRRIKETNYEYVTHHATNFLNGSLHWLARRTNGPPQNIPKEDNYDKNVFVAFSVAEEKFVAEVPRPSSNVCGDSWKFTTEMNVFDGYLCLYNFNSNVDDIGTGFEIWVMKEYMVRDSWTKLCTFLWEAIPPDFHGFSRPLCYSQDGDILLEIGLHGVVKYNMKERKCTTDVFHVTPSDESSYRKHASIETVAYWNSLISPHYDP